MLKANDDWVDWLTNWLDWNKSEENLCNVLLWLDFIDDEDWRFTLFEEIDIIKKGNFQK